MILLYQYPNPEISTDEFKLLNDTRLERVKSAQRLFVLSIIVALTFVLTFIFWPSVIARALLIFPALTALYFVLVGYFNLRSAADTEIFVKIYDDRLESYQPTAYGFRKPYVELMYSEIQKTHEDFVGNLVFELHDGTKQSVYFRDSATKKYLLDNFYEQINYPKVKYKMYDEDGVEIIEEEEEEYDGDPEDLLYDDE